MLPDQAQDNHFGPLTPTYLTISSPQGQRSDASPQDGMSPTTQLLHKKVLIDRSQLLLDGRESELVELTSRDDRRCAIREHPNVQ